MGTTRTARILAGVATIATAASLLAAGGAGAAPVLPHRSFGTAAPSVAEAPRPPVLLLARALQAPYRLPGDDGRTHLVYRVQLTNVSFVPLVVTAVSVRDQRARQLAFLSGDALAPILAPLVGLPPLQSIAPTASAVLLMDLPLTRDADVRSVTTAVGYDVAPGTTLPHDYEQTGFAKRAITPVTPVSTLVAPVLAPPVSGDDWYNANACCDPSTGHSAARITKSTRLHSVETFAIDFIRVRGGQSFSGGGTRNSDYYAYGATVSSASTGTVVSVLDGLPDATPGAFPTDLKSDAEYGGNQVVVRLRAGVYALYGHLQPGSLRVRVGDRVRVGQPLGLLGNSGNSTGAHLHFQLMSGPDVFDAESLPYAFSRFTLVGTVAPGPDGEAVVTGPSSQHRAQYPVIPGIYRF